MLSRLVVAIATEKFPTGWFTTKEILDHAEWFDRDKAAPITTALKRQAKRGYFKSKKDGYYWSFTITEAGLHAGNWAINHAVGIDSDVEKYILWKVKQIESNKLEMKYRD